MRSVCCSQHLQSTVRCHSISRTHSNHDGWWHKWMREAVPFVGAQRRNTLEADWRALWTQISRSSQTFRLNSVHKNCIHTLSDQLSNQFNRTIIDWCRSWQHLVYVCPGKEWDKYVHFLFGNKRLGAMGLLHYKLFDRMRNGFCFPIRSTHTHIASMYKIVLSSGMSSKKQLESLFFFVQVVQS